MELTLPQPAGADFGKPGWHYHDLPQMSPEYFDKLIEVLGSENIQWLTLAERGWSDGTRTKRGQLLVSPEGQERARLYGEKKNG